MIIQLCPNLSATLALQSSHICKRYIVNGYIAVLENKQPLTTNTAPEAMIFSAARVIFTDMENWKTNIYKNSVTFQIIAKYTKDLVKFDEIKLMHSRWFSYILVAIEVNSFDFDQPSLL